MDFKQLSIEVKDMDNAKGIVTAYANAYNFKDSDGDISAYGSFDKTVGENFKRIRVLKDHNPTMMIGVPLAIDTKDSYGLLTTTQFNMNKDLGRDMYEDVKLMHSSGLNAELSIGYQVLQRDAKNKSIIKEYKLMEYSFLSSWGANELSTVQGIKSIKSHYGFMELLTKAYNLPYSDSRLTQIEALLKMVDMGPGTDKNKDVEFIKKMIPHHQDAIDMANEYMDVVENKTLQKLLKDIIEAQTSEIQLMKRIKSLSEKSLLDDTLHEQPIILDTLKSFTQSLNLK
jgi:HK97 family phage prohead protease